MGICLHEEAWSSVLWDVLSTFSYFARLWIVGYTCIEVLLKVFLLAYFVAKKGEKNNISACILYCAAICLCAYCTYFCVMSVACYFLLLHLFCNYFRLCVDVGTLVATSCCSEWWSENLFSIILKCTCSLLMFSRMLEHVWEGLCRCWHKCCNILMLLWELIFLSIFVVHVSYWCAIICWNKSMCMTFIKV